MEFLQRQPCAWHADRASRAMCMSCRKYACEECATHSEGIHYCFECLAARHEPQRSAGGKAGIIAMVILALLVAFAIVRVSVGLGAALAMGLS